MLIQEGLALEELYPEANDDLRLDLHVKPDYNSFTDKTKGPYRYPERRYDQPLNEGKKKLRPQLVENKVEQKPMVRPEVKPVERVLPQKQVVTQLGPPTPPVAVRQPIPPAVQQSFIAMAKANNSASNTVRKTFKSLLFTFLLYSDIRISN